MSADRSRNEDLLAGLGIPYLALALTEFLLGMALNLFGPLPTGAPVHVLEGAPLLDVHFAVGFLLLGISGRAVSAATSLGDRRTVGITTVGLLSGVGAFAAGLDFAFGGGSAAASYVMSVGFVGLLVAAGYLLWRRDGTADRPGVAAAAVPE